VTAMMYTFANGRDSEERVRQDRAKAIRPQPADDVTASELAAFAYCAKAWHLERVLGVQASAQASKRRDDGVTGHQRHGATVRVGSQLGRNRRWIVGVFLMLAALFALLTMVIP
jgi:hypothetical protein